MKEKQGLISLLEPPTEAEIKACFAEAEKLGTSKHAVNEFYRQLERLPSAHELKWVGRFEPHQVVQRASSEVDGAPDTLVPIRIESPVMGFKGVHIYAELTVSALPRRTGFVTGFRSLRYHDGDDANYPMRDEAGEIMRTNGGHIIRSPLFRAPHYNVEDARRNAWPNRADGEGFGDPAFERGMWHVTQFIRPFHERCLGDHRGAPHIDEHRSIIVEPHERVRKLDIPPREAQLETELVALREEIAAITANTMMVRR